MDVSAKNKVPAPQVGNELLSCMLAAQRLGRMVTDLVADQLKVLEVDEINAVQALMLCSVGDVVLSVGSVKHDGHYQGSSPTYNLKKLVVLGYMSHRKNSDDRRFVTIALTLKGQELRARLLTRIEKLSTLCENSIFLAELTEQMEQASKVLDGLVRHVR